MDLGLTADQRGLCDEFRLWLAANGGAAGLAGGSLRPTGDLADEVAYLRSVQAALATGKWVGLHWPLEYGGRGLGPMDGMVLNEEIARAGLPELAGRIGVNLVGPTLLEYGTPEQKTRWLPHILNAEQLWCQLFSEPEAGSDLASLRTSASRRHGKWRLSGQKVWTSYAQFADWGLCLARTTPRGESGSSSRGITAFVVDMRARGVTVRPLVQLTGDAEFNEVFLEDVDVPDDQVIGQVDHGWSVATSTLSRERGTNPRQLVIHLQHFERMMRIAADRGKLSDPIARQAIGRSYVDVHLFRLHTLRLASMLEKRGEIGPEGSVVKLHWSEASKRMHRAILDLLDDESVLWSDDLRSSQQGNWQSAWLYYLGSSIWAGTNELQRSIIGERVLGLPREPRNQAKPSPSIANSLESIERKD